LLGNSLLGNNTLGTLLEKKGSVDMVTTGNVFIGENSGSSVTSGNSCVGIGRNALANNTIGINNTCIGDWCGKSIITGGGNSCFGNSCASALNSISNNNTIIGNGLIETSIIRPELTSVSTNNVLISTNDINGNQTSINNSCVVSLFSTMPTVMSNNIDFGNSNIHNSINELTIGSLNTCNSANSLCVGSSNEANGSASIAIGYLSRANDLNSISIGSQAISTSNNTTAIGFHKSLAVGSLTLGGCTALINNTANSCALSSSKVGLVTGNPIYTLDMASGFPQLQNDNAGMVNIGLYDSQNDPPLPLTAGHNEFHCITGKPKFSTLNTTSFIQLSPTDNSQVIQVLNPVVNPSATAGEMPVFDAVSNAFTNLPEQFFEFSYTFNLVAGANPPTGTFSIVNGIPNQIYFNAFDLTNRDMTQLFSTILKPNYFSLFGNTNNTFLPLVVESIVTNPAPDIFLFSNSVINSGTINDTSIVKFNVNYSHALTIDSLNNLSTSPNEVTISTGHDNISIKTTPSNMNSGHDNVAIGKNTLDNVNGTAYASIAIGTNALHNALSTSNIGIGQGCMQGILNGMSNVCIGVNTDVNAIDVNDNVLIGNDIITGFDFVTAIGSGCSVTEANSLNFANLTLETTATAGINALPLAPSTFLVIFINGVKYKIALYNP
jgi:hypothetical protein